MWDWFQCARSMNIPISGPLIQEKALEFATSLGINEFKASNGWLCRFNQRHNLVCGKMSGERGSVDEKTVINWKEKLPSIWSGYQPRDIFNMDETGIFYRALPDKTMHVRANDCTGGKRSKDRVTCLLCVNVLGEFERPFIVGHSLNPRCFKNIPTWHLPVTYRANKKAWMTTLLYQEWLNALDTRMRIQDRHILLFLDNAPCHPTVDSLTNIKLVFLPANTTSVLQPLDQGIIQNLKLHYRKLLLRRVLSHINDNNSAETIARSINVLDACRWIATALKEVRPITVQRCFSRCGISLDQNEEAHNDEDKDIETVGELLKIASDRNICNNILIDPQVYACFDEEIQITDNLEGDWESRSLENLTRKEYHENVSSDEEESIQPPEIEKASFGEALTWVQNLQYFLKEQSMPEEYNVIASLEDKINQKAIQVFTEHCKQSKLDLFMKLN